MTDNTKTPDTTPDTTKKPDWLELPDAQVKPEEVILWSTSMKRAKVPFWKRCFRISSPRKAETESGDKQWTIILYSEEEANASARMVPGGFEWDGMPAFAITLGEAMRQARVYGTCGVAVKGYRNGKWVTLRRFPADVPLIGDLGMGEPGI